MGKSLRRASHICGFNLAKINIVRPGGSGEGKSSGVGGSASHGSSFTLHG